MFLTSPYNYANKQSCECNGDFSSTKSESDCGELLSRCASASASVREANGPANLLHVSASSKLSAITTQLPFRRCRR